MRTSAPWACRWSATVRAGELRVSSVPGLNAAPSTAIRLPSTSPPAWSMASSASLGPLAVVDRLDRPDQVAEHPDPELVGAHRQRLDVLGQAAAAEAQPGVEELPADPLVVAERVGQLRDVAAGRLAHLGHRVDEADLGGQERVGRGLDQLRGGEVAAHHRHPVADRERVDLLQQGQGLRRSGCRRPAGPAAACPPPRTPRAGTPGSRRPRPRPRPAPGPAAAPPAPSRCRPARWTCPPPGSARSAAGPACRPRRAAGTGRPPRPARTGCPGPGSARRPSPRSRRSRW